MHRNDIEALDASDNVENVHVLSSVTVDEHVFTHALCGDLPKFSVGRLREGGNIIHFDTVEKAKNWIEKCKRFGVAYEYITKVDPLELYEVIAALEDIEWSADRRGEEYPYFPLDLLRDTTNHRANKFSNKKVAAKLSLLEWVQYQALNIYPSTIASLCKVRRVEVKYSFDQYCTGCPAIKWKYLGLADVADIIEKGQDIAKVGNSKIGARGWRAGWNYNTGIIPHQSVTATVFMLVILYATLREQVSGRAYYVNAKDVPDEQELERMHTAWIDCVYEESSSLRSKMNIGEHYVPVTVNAVDDQLRIAHKHY